MVHFQSIYKRYLGLIQAKLAIQGHNEGELDWSGDRRPPPAAGSSVEDEKPSSKNPTEFVQMPQAELPTAGKL